MHDYDLIVIGGGSGGLSLASGAAQLGVKVLLVDKDLFGGDCLHYGCVPSKALIKSGKMAHYMSEADKFGLESVKPKFKWESITKRIADIQAGIQEHDSAKRFRDLGCDVAFGAAQFVDDHTIDLTFNPKLSDQQEEWRVGAQSARFSGKKICIATGSRPNIPEIEGLEETGFITNEQIFSLDKQPRSLAIMGGGVIASEIAQAMNRLGTKVTILEQHAEFFGRFDTDVAEMMTRKFMEEGVDIYVNAKTLSISTKGLQKVLNVDIEGDKQDLVVDEILVATGRRPNIELDLEKAGVEYTARGIVTDLKMRTSKTHITAIGDVNGKAQFTHAANYEAGIVLTNEILHAPAKANYDSIGWTIYTDPEVASIGLDEKGVKRKKIEYAVAKFDLSKNDRALAESETEGFVKIILDKKERVIGCQIASPRAGEMIREWQLVIANKMKLSKVARSTYIYPTFGEASKWAAGSHLAPKLFSPRVKKILKTFFGYRGK